MYRKTYSEQLSEQKGFLLNMQILADAFEDHYKLLGFFPSGNRPTLKSIRHYRNGTTPSISSVYILWAFQVNSLFSSFQDVSLIIIGEPEPGLLSPSTSFTMRMRSSVMVSCSICTAWIERYSISKAASSRSCFPISQPRGLPWGSL